MSTGKDKKSAFSRSTDFELPSWKSPDVISTDHNGAARHSAFLTKFLLFTRPSLLIDRVTRTSFNFYFLGVNSIRCYPFHHNARFVKGRGAEYDAHSPSATVPAFADDKPSRSGGRPNFLRSGTHNHWGHYYILVIVSISRTSCIASIGDGKSSRLSSFASQFFAIALVNLWKN